MSLSNYSSALFTNEQLSAQVEETDYQTGHTGLGFSSRHDEVPTTAPISLDEKVQDADAKLKDFMDEIASLDESVILTEDATEKKQKNSVAGFVSAGHLIPAKHEAPVKSDLAELKQNLAQLVEPVTHWDHQLDTNTQHYYYWNTQTNAVTWTIPQDYSDYLVQLKVYKETREALEEKICSAEEELQVTMTESSTTEIGPQLPTQITPTNDSNGMEESAVLPVSDALVGYGDVSDEECMEESAVPTVSDALVGYGDVSDEECMEEKAQCIDMVMKSAGMLDQNCSTEVTSENGEVAKVAVHSQTVEPCNTAANNTVIGSLVAYGDSFMDDNEEGADTDETGLQETGDSLVQETLDYNTYSNNLCSQHPADAPLIFTAPPPPPPPLPVEEQEVNANGENGRLTSVQLSEYASVITDKLHFLDVSTDDVSKLQMLLIQLKTRLDDWQAGGLDKGYLVQKIQEFDSLIETCESSTAPAGYRCCWCKEKNQYYFIHEITDEVTWVYPEEDKDALLLIAERNSEKLRLKPAGTLAQVSQDIDIRTVDPSLTALFMKKVMEKCCAKSMSDRILKHTEDSGMELQSNAEIIIEKRGKNKRKLEHSEKKSKKKKHSKSKKKKHHKTKHLDDSWEEGKLKGSEFTLKHSSSCSSDDVSVENSVLPLHHSSQSLTDFSKSSAATQAFQPLLPNDGDSSTEQVNRPEPRPSSFIYELNDGVISDQLFDGNVVLPPLDEGNMPSPPPLPPDGVLPPLPPSDKDTVSLEPVLCHEEDNIVTMATSVSQMISAAPSLVPSYNTMRQTDTYEGAKSSNSTAVDLQLSSFYEEIGSSQLSTASSTGCSVSHDVVTVASSCSDTSEVKKAKHKKDKISKKVSTKKSKMPSALVQKWQKVKSEVESEVMNEKRMLEKILQ